MPTDVLYPVLIGVGCLSVVIVVHLLTRKRPSQSDINVPAAGTPDVGASPAPASALAAWHRRHEGSVLDFIEHHDNQMAWADAEPATDDDEAGNGDGAVEVEAGDGGDEPANAARDDADEAPDDDTNGEGDDTDEVHVDTNTDGGDTDGVEAESRGIEGSENGADDEKPAAGRADETGAEENEASDAEAEPDSLGDDHDPEGVGAALEAAADGHPGPDMRAELAAMRAAAEAAHLARGRNDVDAADRHRGVYAGYRGAWLERLQQFAVDNDRIGRLRRRDFPADKS